MPARFLSPREAIAEFVSPGLTLGIGGMHMTAAPMSLVRELVRGGVRAGRLITSPSASMQADLLIGAGLVDEIISPYVGFEHLGLAPCFRRAAETGGRPRILECDEGSLSHALYAGAGGIPFMPCPPGIDLTDIPRVNPEMFRRTGDPFTGEERWAVCALRPDVALIACRETDPLGTVAFGRFPFTDRHLALAAKSLVVQVERMVTTAEMSARSPGETLPGFLVSAVVVAPGGCYPTASPGLYHADEDEIRAYLKAAKDPEGFAGYAAGLDATEDAYLERVAERPGVKDAR
ncbi:MAG: CoA transferase subunit A [Acidobacteria bacterium]|nr:CoA transferase subunit A [Acidobacteriota bacterium]